MKFRDFLKEKLYYIILLAFILISSDILVMIYNISLFMVLYITIVPILGFLICLIIEYNIKNSFRYRKNRIFTNNIAEDIIPKGIKETS